MNLLLQIWKCIAICAFRPLQGFMSKGEYEKVLQHMKLLTGLVWPMPITSSSSKEKL